MTIQTAKLAPPKKKKRPKYKNKRSITSRSTSPNKPSAIVLTNKVPVKQTTGTKLPPTLEQVLAANQLTVDDVRAKAEQARVERVFAESRRRRIEEEEEERKRRNRNDNDLLTGLVVGAAVASIFSNDDSSSTSSSSDSSSSSDFSGGGGSFDGGGSSGDW